MLHEKAIERLEALLTHVKFYKFDKSEEALEYAINQLKEAQLFDQPLEMRVSNDKEFKWHEKRFVLGKLKGMYLSKDESKDNIFCYRYAKEIQPEPLSFKDWYDKNFIKNGYGISIHYQKFEDYRKEYYEYLNKFK